MIEQVWITALLIIYFGGLGILGFYFLWRQYKWFREQEKMMKDWRNK